VACRIRNGGWADLSAADLGFGKAVEPASQEPSTRERRLSAECLDDRRLRSDGAREGRKPTLGPLAGHPAHAQGVTAVSLQIDVERRLLAPPADVLEQRP